MKNETKESKNKSRITIIILLLVTIVLASQVWWGWEGTLRDIDIGFKDGSYQQVNNVMGWQKVQTGTLSHTVDVVILNQDNYKETKRFHYVTSIKVIKERNVTVFLNHAQYKSIIS